MLLGEMEEKIKELQSERAKLKLWDRKHKMELDNEIKQIKGLIKEINEEEITDISGDLIKLLGC